MSFRPEPSHGNGRIILLFFVLLLVTGLIFVFFGNKFNLTKNLHEKFIGDKLILATPNRQQMQSIIIEPPDDKKDWCKIQELAVGDSREDPISAKILGWDSIKNACVMRYTGYSCVLNKVVDVTFAYTGIVGGKVIWLLADGIYMDTNNYKEYVNDLQKSYIENKPCSENIYESVR